MSGGRRRVGAVVLVIAVATVRAAGSAETAGKAPLLPRSRLAVDADVREVETAPRAVLAHSRSSTAKGLGLGALAGAGVGAVISGCMVNPMVQLLVVGELTNSQRWALLGIGTGLGAGLGALTGFGSAELAVHGKERESKACAVVAGCLSAVAIAAVVNSTYRAR